MSLQITNPKFQIDDNNGVPLAAGKVYTYVVGTTTLATTYSDTALTPNANPVILNERGECVIYTNQALKIKVTDKDDTTIWTQDNVGVQSIGDYYLSNYASLSAAIAAIGSATGILHVTSGTWPVSANLTVPTNVTLQPDGGILQVATGVTLTILRQPKDSTSQMFSCVGTGQVSGLYYARPEWFGAARDGSTDDTAALTSCSTGIVTGGTIQLLQGVYKTTGWLITKDVSLISESPMGFITNTGTVLRAAGAQEYVLKLFGTFGLGDGTTFVHPYLRNLTIDGNSQAISDAALVMDVCQLIRAEGLVVKNALGHGIRLRTCWESRFTDPYIFGCGTVDTGSAVYVDGPSPFDVARGSSDVSIIGGVWSSNRGRWLEVSSLANLDVFWLEHNKFEVDVAPANTVSTNVLHFGSMSRATITNNTFTGFGRSSGNYGNLIYISGDPANLVFGLPGSTIVGNKAEAYAVNGAINGVYLDTNAPTVLEYDNTFIVNDGNTCSNVNVSTYPQLINASWKNFSSSLYPMNPMPDQEMPGFVSIHTLQRGTFNDPFVTDPGFVIVNNAGTVLREATADTSNPRICQTYDLSRYIAHTATNLLVRIRMRLDAAGSVTVFVNPSNPVWNGVSKTVNSTAWAWYSFTCPIATITAANHLMDVFLWTIDSGTPRLLVDGIEFATS